MMNYVIFKNDLYCKEKLHFKKGKKYEIITEIDGKYAISYMRKNRAECSIFPKDFDGFEKVV